MFGQRGFDARAPAVAKESRKSVGLERYLDTTVPDMMGEVWDRRRARLNFPYLDGRLAVHTEAGEEAMRRLCGAGRHDRQQPHSLLFSEVDSELPLSIK